MKEQKFDYGMIGLGTMGRNLVYNMSDHGYTVIGFDKNNSQVETLKKEAGNDKVSATSNLDEFLKALKTPKVIIMLVPAGKIVDEVINELKPFLSEDDLLMDCGNSHFTDTNKRNEQLEESAIHFMGVGISGGELGARHGPSIMPGGPKKVYERVAKMLEAVSAKVNKEPCVTWLGPGSAGHYVKMVHNGIEYGLMQLISEVYHLLKQCAGMNNDELHTVFSKWNEGELQSYLIEITADIFTQKDELTDSRIIDKILDSAKQNGTGTWTSEDAMSLQVPIPVIDIAVSMRDLSAYKKERQAVQKNMQGPETKFTGDKKELVKWVEQALYFSIITVYAQGMALLQSASEKYNYGLKLENIAAIWRGGCIIRASLLEEIRTAFSQQPDLSNLLLSDAFSKKLMQSQIGIRKAVQTAVESGVPVPAMMGALAYFDSYRSGWLPANLIQAQRDDFGAHTYERNDREGIFHTHWNQKK
ncbi:NADP-dependent phosphogluconate dehydrogenase [Ferruginibacter sp.]|uniref:NADP-dependent phosphogluconate dehydrogenase n=1 Tax=Ferruginibacter sp. TaxID=1940288 RepID=UPI0019914B52|nr:NADP-dependent phosphogluconate dehydrogenase [Ferruginibacter sp.]MBC7629478.1 NADP-dependent phosphogluconate dehydrogenase [Ferruginibacter sp.]